MKAVFALDGWSGRPGGAWERCAVFTPETDGPTVVMVWADDVPPAEALFGRPARRWVVEERVQWDTDDGAVPAVTQLSFVRRLPPLSRDAFAAHWSERHAPLARVHHPGIGRYVQHVVLDGDDETDGIAELGFPTRRDLEERMYDSDEGKRAIREDVARFLDLGAGWRILGIETRFSSG